MNKRQTRIAVIATAAVLLLGATGLVLMGLERNIVYFYGASQILADRPAPDRLVRVGGLVEEGSIVRTPTGATTFVVTDRVSRVPVSYPYDPPDLFREGQGVVAEGRFGADGLFTAEMVLAKHDESYMPREVAEALKEAGEWRPETGQSPADLF
jgi:cytochrome c-type biogenesis protein CcmE